MPIAAEASQVIASTSRRRIFPARRSGLVGRFVVVAAVHRESRPQRHGQRHPLAVHLVAPMHQGPVLLEDSGVAPHGPQVTSESSALRRHASEAHSLRLQKKGSESISASQHTKAS